MTVRIGRLWRRPISKSTGSWPGVTLITPVPKSGSTASSATTRTETVPSTDRPRQPGVHREPLARPVTGRAEALELAHDRAAGFLFPFPRALEIRLATQAFFGLPLGGQLPLEEHVDRDRGVIGPGDPQRVEAIHPLHAHEHVLQRVVERV